ncbi:ABC transporter substrate-binding protein [Salmonella enterica]
MFQGVSRRSLIKNMGLLAGSALFSNCLYSMDKKTSWSPKKGGVLRAAFTGSNSGLANVLTATRTPLGYVRARLIWDTLADIQNGKIEYRLMESVEPDSSATRWTLKIRPGITFSDGRTLTARDVLYSLQQLATTPGAQSGWLAPLDVSASRVQDEQTLTLQLKQPVGAFDWRLAQGMMVFPANSKPERSIPGSGAWVLGEQSSMVTQLLPRLDYWDSASGPWLDRIELYAVDDMNARVNGLKGGQFNYVAEIGLVNAHTEQRNSQVQVLVAPEDEWRSLAFSMNLSTEPFNRQEVVEALKLAINRDEMARILGFGFGKSANDALGVGQHWYAPDLPQRHYDPEQAKVLLQKAGIIPRASIRTSNFAWGLAESAALLLRQSAPAGFSLSVNKLPVADFYSDIATLINTPLKTNSFPSMPLPVMLPFYYGSEAPYSFTGPASPQLDTLMKILQAAHGDSMTQAIHDVQYYLYQHGGDAIFARLPSVAMATKDVRGIRSGGAFEYPLLRGAWLES